MCVYIYIHIHTYIHIALVVHALTWYHWRDARIVLFSHSHMHISTYMCIHTSIHPPIRTWHTCTHRSILAMPCNNTDRYPSLSKRYNATDNYSILTTTWDYCLPLVLSFLLRSRSYTSYYNLCVKLTLHTLSYDFKPCHIMLYRTWLHLLMSKSHSP